jgi:hypothetical protein
MLDRHEKLDVYLDFEPPQKWPLWFLNHEALDVPDLAPISSPLKGLAWLVNAYFAANTNWCETASQFFFHSKATFEEFNRLAHSLSTRLIAELGEEFKVKPVIVNLNRTGHVEFCSNKGNLKPAAPWLEHACSETALSS